MVQLFSSDRLILNSFRSEDELKLELVIALYKQDSIGGGKVRAWTGLTVLEFQHELANRGLCITMM